MQRTVFTRRVQNLSSQVLKYWKISCEVGRDKHSSVFLQYFCVSLHAGLDKGGNY